MNIASKNMLAEKGRFAFSVAGVGVAALLLSFMLALYSGWNERIASYVADVPADIWLAQRGNESFFSASLISDQTIDAVGETEGVTGVSTLLGRGLKVRANGDTYDSYVLGYEGDSAGPIHIKEGASVPADGEIIIDNVLARTAGIDVGDEIIVGDTPLKVVGISTGGNVVLYQLSFVSIDTARQLVGVTGFANFALLNAEDGMTDAVVAQINAENEDVTAFERSEFASSSRKVLQRTMLPILSVLIVLIFIVGAVIVGVTIYTATLEKEREYGVMKALGTPNKQLLGIVAQQTLICCLIGFVVGEIAVLGASRIAERAVPQFVTLIRWQDAGVVLAATMIMGLIGAYLPVQRVLRVDPLRVFKA